MVLGASVCINRAAEGNFCLGEASLLPSTSREQESPAVRPGNLDVDKVGVVMVMVTIVIEGSNVQA